MRELPPIDWLKKAFAYDPDTGVLTRNGKRAGSQRVDGYRRVLVNGRLMYEHHVAFAMHNGFWATCRLDHVDCDPTNNRAANLREALPVQNSQNKRVRKDSATGVKGVRFVARLSKFRAVICVNGKQKHLGLYATAEEAHSVYLAAAVESFGEFARG